MRISGVASTDLFGGTAARALQIIKVTVTNAGPGMITSPHTAIAVTVQGQQVGTPEAAVLTGLTPGAEVTAEVPVEFSGQPQPGTVLPVLATATGPEGSAELAAEVTVAEPGWVMWMVSHFHYDPVWWSTQGQFLQSRLLLPDDHGEMPEVRTAFELVRLHLDAARRDPDYKFVLAETDYLKPHFDAHPEDRADLLDFIAAGRIELVGGNYNEPNTNLTCAESTIRNAVYGIAYQRDVLRGNPRTSWMLDAFGFDPGYPGLMAAAGLTDSAWARGPFHQWGPNRSVGDNTLMQFASEFEWLSPDGSGLLTSYMANHYGAGWVTHQAKDRAAAEAAAYEQFSQLAPVAATRNVLLPVGADHVIPSRWVTEIHRHWNSRYTWPKFVMAVPSEFFAAVRAEAADRDIWITPQTRDMNPVYTGKDVTYIDTKQAQRAAETAVLDGERLATLAWLTGAPYPTASLDKAWRQLVFGAHHDAITGTEGDQVYLDLLGGWREAWERGEDARGAAIAHLSALADTQSLAHDRADADSAFAIVVFNSLSLTRSAMATAELDLPSGWPSWLTLHDETGSLVPFLAEGVERAADGALRRVTITFRAIDVPGVGYRSFLAAGAAADGQVGWQPAEDAAASDHVVIENEHLLVASDPARGGTLDRVLHKRSGNELLQAGGGGNELLLQPEHPGHPRWAEGPWLLCPAGPGTGSASTPAGVRAERCPVGNRLVAEFALGGMRFIQETVLWDGAHRVEFRTHADGSIGQDKLLRVLFPANVAGGLPVYQTAVSVIGRPPGPIDVDVAQHSYTQDCPANEWFALGSTAAVAVTDAAGNTQRQAIGVAEVVTPPSLRAAARDLMIALAAQGVTATCSTPTGPRYGYSELDSNLPDFRISLGGPDQNAFSAEVLAGAPADALPGRVWVSADRNRVDAFGPGADVRGARDLPVLIVSGENMPAAVADLVADLDDAVIAASAGPGQPDARADRAGGPATALGGNSVALLNRGTPSGLVTPEGVLSMALMRACSTWPCGIWIDGEKRTTPDGTSFAWQHWSHTFEYSLAAGPGDWRTAGFPAGGQNYNNDLLPISTSLHPGQLPATASLAAVEPGRALLSTLKPRGNPLYPGGSPDAADGVTARLRDITGSQTDAQVRLFTGLESAAADSLCEDEPGPELKVADSAAHITVPRAGMVTMTMLPLELATPEPAPTEPAPIEPAQPVHSRYWMHGKGPAPAGNVPVAVHLTPTELALDAGPGMLRLAVACGAVPAAGAVQLAAPADVVLEPAGPLGYELEPYGYQCWDIGVRATPGAAAGRRFVTAQIVTGPGEYLEDSALLVIGQPAPPVLDLPLTEVMAQQQAVDAALESEVDISLAVNELSVAPGAAAAIEVAVANRCLSAIRGEAQLISPFGSWRRIRPWTMAFAVEPGVSTNLTFELAVPASARPGEQWWAIIKLMYFGRVRYSLPVRVSVA